MVAGPHSFAEEVTALDKHLRLCDNGELRRGQTGVRGSVRVEVREPERGSAKSPSARNTRSVDRAPSRRMSGALIATPVQARTPSGWIRSNVGTHGASSPNACRRQSSTSGVFAWRHVEINTTFRRARPLAFSCAALV